MELINGTKGELTILVDGKAVAQKGDSLPTVDQMVTAVRKGTLAEQVFYLRNDEQDDPSPL